MSPGFRKFALIAHLTVSVGWIGAVLAFLTLVAGAMAAEDARTLRAAWLAMEQVGTIAIVPLALASVVTGLVIALGTKWGLFRHYWVLISFVLTIVATAVLLSNMQTVSFYAALAARSDDADVAALRSGLRGELGHAGIGLVVLLVIQTVNVYKPRGLTRYGWRKQLQERALPSRRKPSPP